MFRKMGLLLITFLLTVTHLAAQEPDEWIVNLDAILQELPQNHVNPFTRIPENEFLGNGELLRRDIPNLTNQQILMGLARLVASLGDSHTALVWPPQMIYPVQLGVFEEGIYALATYPEASDALGARLVTINGYPITEVIEQVGTVIPHENHGWLNAQLPNYLIRSEVLMGLSIIPGAESVEWAFVTSDGEAVVVEIAPIAPNAVNAADFVTARDSQPRTESTNGFYWLELFDDGTLYFKYNQAVEAPDLPMTQFADILFTVLDEQPVERLVIDLRDNTGGNSTLVDPLIDTLIAHPINTEGRLFVIIGNRTYSSAVLNAVRLSQETNAILVGQPTGGAPDHFGEVQSFDLPFYDLTVNYSTTYFELMPGLQDMTLFPDVVVPVLIADYLAGINPFYAAVMAYQPE
jgi:hypothetical protein